MEIDSWGLIRINWGAYVMLDLLDLSNIPLFVDNSSIELSDINMVYGKNGTGKSTLAIAIAHQFDDPDHCVIFNGMGRFIRADQQLNAILLGTRNLEIEKKIAKLTTSRVEIAAAYEAASKTLKNQKTNFSVSIQSYQNFVWENIYRHFHDKFPTDLAGWGGSKKTFAEKLKQLGKKLPIESDTVQSENEILTKRSLIKTGVSLPNFNTFPSMLDVRKIKEMMLKTLKSVARGEIAKQIATRKLESWVQQGQAYLRPNEPCPFCGQEITQNHYELLEAEFLEIIDSAYQNFQNDIVVILGDIQKEQRQLQNWQEGVEEQSGKNEIAFKVSVSKEVASVNAVLQLLFTTVKSKKEHSQQSINIDKTLSTLNVVLEDLSSKIKEVNERISTNNQLVAHATESENKLHNHVLELMRIRCLQPDVQACQSKVKDFQTKLRYAQADEDKKRTAVEGIDEELSKLKTQTRSEEEAATRINNLLGLLGDKRFKLVLPPLNKGVSGYYTIEGQDGERRPVSALSTGEENLIAFLYFFYLVEAKLSNEEPLVAIIDDPVTSNDDQSMFLIVTMIQNLFFKAKELNTSGNRKLQIFVLTHNSSFYINLKEWTRNPYTKSNRSFHLSSTSVGSLIEKIAGQDDDIINNYDELWREARFSFDTNQKQALWNQIRRILETYVKFNNWSSSLETVVREKIIAAEDTEKKLIALQLVKIAHANSHSIDDLMQDLSPWSKEQIRDAFEFVMEVLGGCKHFKAHWNKDIT